MIEKPKTTRAPKAKEGEEWTYKEWYSRNKEALAQRRKNRYDNDKNYRTKVLDQNKEYRAKRTRKKPVDPATGKPFRGRVTRHRKPVTMIATVGGEAKEVTMVHIGAFAKAISRSVPTIHQWERVGLLPKTPFNLNGRQKQERLYTAEMIDVVKRVLKTRGLSISSSDATFHQEIRDGWIALGIKMEPTP